MEVWPDERACAGIVDRLAAIPGTSTSFNPYAERDPLIDLADAPAIRRANLLSYLQAIARSEPDELWLGEAPSRFGARRTGVPFTSEGRLASLSPMLHIEQGFQKATDSTQTKHSSITSGAIWSSLPETLPLFWNAVLHHTHRGAAPLRNRTPRRTEVRAHRAVLALLVETFRPKCILAIGRVAEHAAGGLGVPVTYVRHPAQGGANAFRDGVAAFLGDRRRV